MISSKQEMELAIKNHTVVCSSLSKDQKPETSLSQFQHLSNDDVLIKTCCYVDLCIINIAL